MIAGASLDRGQGVRKNSAGSCTRSVQPNLKLGTANNYLPGAPAFVSAELTNFSISCAISSGSSSIGKWLMAFTRIALNQGCSAANDCCACQYTGSEGCA